MPLPAPRTWSDGEEPANIPGADDINLDWRDSFDFLMGDTRPMGLFRQSTTGFAVTTTFANVPFTTEVLKRGGITHSNVTNSHLITVPYTGQYQGYFMAGFETISSTGLRLLARILQNGTTEIARVNIPNAQLGHFSVNGSFTANLAANDNLTLQMAMGSGTATSGQLLTRVPRLGIWYVGDYQ